MATDSSNTSKLRPDETYTYRKLVGILHITYPTFRRWTREGLKGHRINGRAQFLGADVMRKMLEDGTLEEPAELLVGNPVIPFHVLEYVIERMAGRTAKILEAKLDPEGRAPSPRNRHPQDRLTKGVILDSVTYSVDGLIESLGISRGGYIRLRSHGMPARREGIMILINGKEFNEWVKTLPLAPRLTARKSRAKGALGEDSVPDGDEDT